MTASPKPSATAYSTVTTSSALAGAVKRIRPLAVVRATAPLRSPPTAVADSSDRGSPSAVSRQSGSTGTSRVPPDGTVQTFGSKPSRRCGGAFTGSARGLIVTVAWADTSRPSSM